MDLGPHMVFNFEKGLVTEVDQFNHFHPSEVTRLPSKLTGIPDDVSKLTIEAKYDKNENGAGGDFRNDIRKGTR